MFDWLHALYQRLAHFLIHVPILVAGPSMILIGALDSSLVSLPEVNDYLVMARCYTHPRTVYFFALFAAIGSVLGCWLLYTILRRGGQAVLHRRFRIDHVQRVERAYARFGILALAVPALMPPPTPFKIFVATAGALQFPRRKFLITIFLARALRYYVEGTLAVFYGERVGPILKDNASLIISVVVGLCIIALAAYLVSSKGRAAVARGKERS